MFSVKVDTVVVAATIDSTPNEISNENSAMARGIPAATSEPNASTRMSRLSGNAICSARLRSSVVVWENSW
jgi:hypothetical protein